MFLVVFLFGSSVMIWRSAYSSARTIGKASCMKRSKCWFQKHNLNLSRLWLLKKLSQKPQQQLIQTGNLVPYDVFLLYLGLLLSARKASSCYCINRSHINIYLWVFAWPSHSYDRFRSTFRNQIPDICREKKWVDFSSLHISCNRVSTKILAMSYNSTLTSKLGAWCPNWYYQKWNSHLLCD